jgi:glutathione synthase/RimK-type ligase-like ATP-grasp enzyme
MRGHSRAIFYSLQYLAYLNEIGANVINGYDAYVYEFSKAKQLGLFERLGLLHPRARVINHPSQAPAAADRLTFPVIIKPNIGGSGAKIVRFNAPEELEIAVKNGLIDLGIDQTALVQEYLPAESNSIIRVEVLNGGYLYAIRLFLRADEFNLCPADYCRVPSATEGLADGVSGRKVPVERYDPPSRVINDAIRITKEAHMEIGGVEYLINARDGKPYYYDVNALSNFVADAEAVIGFDPLPKFVDYLLDRAGMT